MRSAVAIVMCSLVVGLPVGCAEEKQLPGRGAVVAPDTPGADSAIPTESDPKAKDVVDRCLKAATGGDPAKLAKTRISRMVCSGHMILAGQNNVPVETTFKTEAVWPDRVRADREFKSDAHPSIAVGFRRPTVWMFLHENRSVWKEVPQASPAEAERLAAIESVGNYWMVLLVPLTDPKTVVFGAESVTTGPQPAEKVKAFVPGCPVFTLWFDPATNFLRRIEYTKTSDRGQTLEDVMILDGHKPFDGINMPTSIEHQLNAMTVEKWTVDSVEYPPSIDEARFDPPKSDAKK